MRYFNSEKRDVLNFKKNYKISYIIILIILAFYLLNVTATDYPIVPAGHPRLFITPSDISILQTKKDDPGFRKIWNDIVSLADSHFLSAALIYLVNSDVEKGNWAVNQALTALQNKPGTDDAISKSSNIMNRAACVYDWCYDLLSTTQKNNFISEFERLANTNVPYYPADYHPYSVFVGDIAEGIVQLSQLIAGCAIYDENQTMWNAAVALHWDKFIPARNNLYPMHMYWQGDSFFGRFLNDSYNAWFYRKLGAGDVYVPDMQYVPYGTIYNTRPDGRQMKRGDRYDEKGNAGKKGAIFRTMAMYWNNPYLTTLGDHKWYNYYGGLSDGYHDMEKVFEFVFRPSGLTGAPLTDLPLTKFFPDPMGEMIARTGWDWLNEESNDVVVTMEMGGCDFKGHTNPGHFGGFQIYYKGALAISSGCYQNESAHDDNYHEKSQSHNVLLILDPQENTSYGTGGIYTANDGGQICQPTYGTYGSKPADYAELLSEYRKAYVTGHQFGPDQITPEYSYISGDLTPAYSNKPKPKVQEVRRSMVMLNHFDDTYPATLIIFDRIVSTNSSFKKTWQIHSIEEPQINTNTITIRRTASHYEDGPSGGIGNYSGKLVVQKLLPTRATVEKIGGNGFDCWIDFEKKNYPPDPQSENYDDENGMWRVEVSPSYARYEDLFLNVLTVMDNSTNNHPDAELIYNDFIIGAKILDRLICFSRTGTELRDQFDLTVPGSDNVKVLVCDLEPGFWTIKNNNRTATTCLATEEGRCIDFTVTGGSYLLAKETTAIINDITYKKSFILHENYPNPFNSSTTIQFALPDEAKVVLEIFNLAGQKIVTLLDKRMGMGYYKVNWDAANMPSGLYFYRIKAASFTDLKKMILIK
jgi:heparin/heparan-sulfate lyase